MPNILSKNRGHTIVEILIAMAVFSVIMVSITSFFIFQDKTYLAQGGIVEMQRNSRNAMRFIIKQLREATSVDVIDVETDQITFNPVEDNLTRSFSYDGDNDLLTFSKGGTPVRYFRNVSNFTLKGDSANASDVKKIKVTLETHTENLDPIMKHYHYCVSESDVTLRNLI